jgi:oxygen-independent coproporphyrinogen III oxidase
MRAISSRSSVAEIVAFIEANLELNPGNLVQFNHPSSHHFQLLEDDDPTTVEELLADERARRTPDRRSTVYAAFPFCIPTQPKDCGFCPFPKVDLGDDAAGATRSTAVAGYVDRLARELEMVAPHMGLPHVADAVYIGGGTPNLMTAEEAHGFVTRLLAAFPPRAGAEVTFEGIPYLFTQAEKIVALRAAGVTRASIGAQQLKDHLIRLSGRSTQTRRTVEQSVALMQEHGLDHSVDLIFGWPQQTFEDALDDVATVASWRVPHVTVYPLNQPKGIAFSSPPYVDQIASVRERVRMYRGIRDLLVERGYRQVTMSDYQLADRSHFDYENFTHDPLNTDMRAVGYSGFSRCAGTAERPGTTWIAPHELPEYYRQVDAGRLPLRAYFRFTAADVELSWMLNQLQEMSLSIGRYREGFGKDVLAEHASLWEALVQLGWASIDSERVTLVGDGVFYTALVQRMLAFERDQELRQHRTMIGYRARGRFLPTVNS